MCYHSQDVFVFKLKSLKKWENWEFSRNYDFTLPKKVKCKSKM